MTWGQFLPSVAMALALGLLPGWLVVRAGGMRGFFGLAAAPAVSVSLVAGSAIAGGILGVPFGLVPVAVATVAAGVVALAFSWLRGRARAESLHAFPGRNWAWWGALAIAAALWARHIRNVLDVPDSFSQTFDNVWHLNAVRYILDSGDGSSLTVAHLNSSNGGFYPAAFHDLAALVTMFNGGHLTMGVNAVAAVICGVVWPLSAMFLVRSTFRPSVPTTLGVGVLAASFTAFPLLFLDFGILYANLLGLALVPVVIGVVVQLGGLGEDRWIDWPTGVILLVATVPALLVAHPNAFMLLLLVASALMVAVIARQAVRLWAREDRGARPWLRIAIPAVVIAATVVAWPILRPGTSVDDWPAPLSTPAALGHALLNAPLWQMANWTVSILMVIGIAVAARRRVTWLAGAWGVVVFFWLVVSSFVSTEFRLLLVGIWYNDSSRFAANLPILALPLAALGTDWVVRRTGEVLTVLPRVGRLLQPRLLTALLSVAVVVVAVAGTQRTTAMDMAVDSASGLYQITPESPLVNSDEYAILSMLPDLVPPDAVIANNPWNGSALAYALEGRRVTAPHILYGETPLREIVRVRLDEAETDPVVCLLLEQEDVRYVLDFGSMDVHGVAYPWPGFDQLSQDAGFVEIARRGDAALYEITACG